MNSRSQPLQPSLAAASWCSSITQLPSSPRGCLTQLMWVLELAALFPEGVLHPWDTPEWGWHCRSDPERARKGTPMGGEPWSILQVKSPGFQAQDSSRSNFSALLLGVLFVLRPKTPGGPRWLCRVAISLLASNRGRLPNLAQLPGTRGASVHQLCSPFPKKRQHTQVFSAS